MHICIHTYMHTYMQIPRQVSHIHAYIHTYIQIPRQVSHIHTYIHTYIHTDTSASFRASTARSSSIFRRSSAIFRCSSANNPRTISIAAASTFRVSEARCAPPHPPSPPSEDVPGGLIGQWPVRNPGGVEPTPARNVSRASTRRRSPAHTWEHIRNTLGTH
jgi:hypothetical protein